MDVSGISSSNWQSQIESMTSQMRPEVNMMSEVSKIFSTMGDLFKELSAFTDMLGAKPPMGTGPGVVNPPDQSWGSHPAGSLQTKGDVVTTPGGYNIEQEGQYNWKITGPDGKSTNITGDPHVSESDGGKWDFQRDASFRLPDGTQINVNVAPYGDQAAVTSGLEIINGNDRVQVSGIDKGKGQIGPVTEDGYLATIRNNISDKIDKNRDTFTMGQETDDWSFLGREIKGGTIEKDGTSKLTLGKELEPLVQQTDKFGGGSDWAKGITDNIREMLPDLKPPRNPIQDMITGIFGGLGQSKNIQDPNDFKLVDQGFKTMGDAFTLLKDFTDMGRMLSQEMASDNRRFLM